MTNSVVWFLIHFLGISVTSVHRAHPPPPPSTGLLLSTVQCLPTLLTPVSSLRIPTCLLHKAEGVAWQGGGQHWAAQGPPATEPPAAAHTREGHSSTQHE